MMLLTLKNIVAGYGNITALKGISLSVPEGKIVTLIGANGAGKSTTMKTIMGLMKPSEGEIRFKDKSITGQKSFHIVNAGVVLVPEGRQILQNMTVRENLELGAYQRKDKAEIREDMVKVFQRFPRLLERENQFGGTLSGGEQQMLAIARAMMARPQLMLLDEPSMGLAPLVVQQIFDVIKDINKMGTCSSCRTECTKSAADCRLCLCHGNGKNRYGRTGCGSGGEPRRHGGLSRREKEIISNIG